MEASPPTRKRRSVKRADPPPPSLTTENFKFASFRASAGIGETSPPPVQEAQEEAQAQAQDAQAQQRQPPAPAPPTPPAPPPPTSPSVLQQMQKRLSLLDEAESGLMDTAKTKATNEMERMMAKVGSEGIGAAAATMKKVISSFSPEEGAKQTTEAEAMERLAAWELVGAVLPTLEECAGDQAARDKAMMLKVAVARQHLRRSHHKMDGQALEQQIQDARATSLTTAAQALTAMCDAGGGAGAAPAAAAPAQDNSELLQRISRLEAQHELVRLEVGRIRWRCGR